MSVSPYRRRFRQGATFNPRRFFLVEYAATGRLQSRREAPRVKGRVGNRDNAPWTTVNPPEGPIERSFLRPVALGQSIAPFRILGLATGVVPLANGEVLTSQRADILEHRGLAAWLRDAETKWNEHSNKDAEGNTRMSLAERIDAMGTLRAQANRAAIRVFYAASGTYLSACWFEEEDAIVDKTAYWAAAHSIDEASYLSSVLNSEVVLNRIKDLQPLGERNPRHFDNLVWTLPIPEFDAAEALHRDLAVAGLHAAVIAARVELPNAEYFTTKRRIIREALVTDGVAGTIERLVDALLPL